MDIINIFENGHPIGSDDIVWWKGLSNTATCLALEKISSATFYTQVIQWILKGAHNGRVSFYFSLTSSLILMMVSEDFPLHELHDAPPDVNFI